MSNEIIDEVEVLIEAAGEVLGEFSLREDFCAGSVAAAVKSSSGKIYTGICLDVACGIGFCAEHAAITEMLKSRETAIEMVVAIGDRGPVPPCGRCRELMMQIDEKNSDAKIVLGSNQIMLLKELLPEHWL